MYVLSLKACEGVDVSGSRKSNGADEAEGRTTQEKPDLPSVALSIAVNLLLPRKQSADRLSCSFLSNPAPFIGFIVSAVVVCSQLQSVNARSVSLLTETLLRT